MGGLAIETIRDGVQFVPDAAAAFRRAEAQVRVEFGRGIDVNSTFRSWADQMKMFDNWNAYVGGWGPYPGHSKAVHPSESFHVSGLALDSDDRSNPRIVQILAENGFIRNRLYVPNEQHHFEYIRSEDKNYGKPASGGNATPTPAAEQEEEDEDMAMKGLSYRRTSDNALVVATFNEISGFYSEVQDTTGEYNTPIAQAWEVRGAEANKGSWPALSESHVNALKRDLALVRTGKS